MALLNIHEKQERVYILFVFAHLSSKCFIFTIIYSMIITNNAPETRKKMSKGLNKTIMKW